jgi:hypothetical protein
LFEGCKSFPRGLERALDLRLAVRAGDKPRLVRRRREINPRSSMAWKKRLKRSLSDSITSPKLAGGDARK